MLVMKIAGAFFAALLLPYCCSLLGSEKQAGYTVEDIRSVSISCGHMNYAHSYSFFLRKEESGWLLDADFAADSESPHTEYAECPVTERDAQSVLDIVEQQKLVQALRRYKKPIVKVTVSDETMYYTLLGLANGESIGAPKRVSEELETEFYRLADQYADSAKNREAP